MEKLKKKNHKHKGQPNTTKDAQKQTKEIACINNTYPPVCVSCPCKSETKHVKVER